MQIIGVLLVKNEDLHIRWVIENILDFCDRILVLDNHSTDHTREIIERLARASGKIILTTWDNARNSQRALTPYYGTNTWVLGVDGDEVYDPVGLASMRKRLLSGEFDRAWNVRGNFLHVVSMDLDVMRASGYSAPPARVGLGLYNFKVVKEWGNEEVERLHGTVVFREDPAVRHPLFLLGSAWEESELRCLHLCFIRRSSNEAKPCTALKHWMLKRWIVRKLYVGSGSHPSPRPKRNLRRRLRDYAVGTVVTVDIRDFRP